jgi:hypothetical protein
LGKKQQTTNNELLGMLLRLFSKQRDEKDIKKFLEKRQLKFAEILRFDKRDAEILKYELKYLKL